MPETRDPSARSVSRRRVLAAGAATAPALAGCLAAQSDDGGGPNRSSGSTDGDGTSHSDGDGTGDADGSADSSGGSDPAGGAVSGHVRPDHDPETARSPLSCDREEVQRLRAGYGDVAWGRPASEGNDSPFRLRVDAVEAAYGDVVTVELTNASGEDQYTGNHHKYNLETLTEDGWQDVRVATDGEFVGYTDEAIEHAPGEGFDWELELTEDGLVAGHVYEDRLAVCPALEPGRYRFVFWEPTVAVAWDLIDGG